MSPSQTADASISAIELQSDALTITRSRLLEINYVLRVTAHTASLTTDLNVELPITIVNFISLYPPPSQVEGPSLRVNIESGHLTTTADSDLHCHSQARCHTSHDENIPLRPHSLYTAERLPASYRTKDDGLFNAKDQYPALSQSHVADRPQSQPKEYRRSLPEIRSRPHIADPNVLARTASALGENIEMSRNVQRRLSTLDTLDSDEEVERVVRSTPIHDFEMDSQSSSSVFGAKSDFITPATSDETPWPADRSHPYTSLPVGDRWDGGARSQRLAPLGPRSRSQPRNGHSPPSSRLQHKELHTLPWEDSTSEQRFQFGADHSTSSGCTVDEDDRSSARSGSTDVVQSAGHISLDSDMCEVLLSVDAVNATSESVSGDSFRTLAPRHHIGILAMSLDTNSGVSRQPLGRAHPISKQPGISADGQQTGSGFRDSTSTSIQERIAKLEMAGLGSNR
jgi:hypothetical protein